MATVADFSKTERRQLRALAGRAYEEELGDALDPLYEDFRQWKGGELSPSELSDRIHRFHQGPGRDLYRRYGDLDATALVARGIALGLLSENDVEPATLEKLKKRIRFFEERNG